MFHYNSGMGYEPEEELSTEQKEIVSKIKSLSKTSKETGVGIRFSWNNYNGKVTCNIVKHYLGRRLRKGLKVVGPAFIKGLPKEFDILIVDEKAEPEEFTDAYDPKSVHLIVEVKSHGTYSEDALKRIKQTFERLEREYGLKCAYLAIRESGRPKRGGRNWVKVTQELLKPYSSYFLSDSRTGDLYPNQWRQFVEYVNSF